MIHDLQGHISLHPHSRRVRVLVGDVTVADTQGAIELREKGYPPRQYIPRQDVDMTRLIASEKITHCPFKGDASYYAVEGSDATLIDAVWSYEQPFDAMTGIRGYLAFDTRQLEEKIDE